MLKLSQNKSKKLQHRHSVRQIQDQNILTCPRQELAGIIRLKLLENPELEINDPTDLEDEEEILSEDDDNEWNEYETGDPYTEGDYEPDDVLSSLYNHAIDLWEDDPKRLEQAIGSIDEYKFTGILTDEILQEYLSEIEENIKNSRPPSKEPDIKVIVDNGRVLTRIVHDNLNHIAYKDKSATDTVAGSEPINDIRVREKFLRKLAHVVLSDLQRDFFTEDNFDTALLNLVPIETSMIEKKDLCLRTLAKLMKDKSEDDTRDPEILLELLYKTNRLMVSCSHGDFPFMLFRLKKADLVLIWCRAAERNGITGPSGQLRWIKEQIEKRVNTWSPEDNRFNFIKSLREIKINDIKNSKKKESK